MSMKRSETRVLAIGKRKLERRMYKLKRHMNKLYAEYIACERAMELFKARTPAETAEAVSKEQELRKEIVQEMEKLEESVENETPKN